MEDSRPTLAQYFVEQACPDNRFLEKMDSTIPWWEIQEWFDGHIYRNANRTGRPAYPLMLMFKIHLLQQWYNLSDREAEFQINDRLSFRKFLGLSIEDNVPDATTIENFRHLIWEEQDVGKGLMKVLDKYFKQIGLITREGNLIDATFLQANSKSHADPNKNSDVDAQYGHKGFGYSGTINMDKKSKLIRKTVVTGANVLDFKSMKQALVGDEKVVYGDKGYVPARKQVKKRYPNIELRIMHKRQRGKKGELTPELNVFQQEDNRRYARERARVEHAFAAIKSVFKFRRLRYRGLERVTAKFNSLCIAYNFYRLGFLMKNQGITV